MERRGHIREVLFGLLSILLASLACTGPSASDPDVELAPLPQTPPSLEARTGFDGYDSPYIGKTGSWDGAARQGNGNSRIAYLDMEAAMGLRWTFMTLYWSALEPDGPVALNEDIPDAWQHVDQFVRDARARDLHILLQITVGGNAGGPPDWAGQRVDGSSAPEDMDALVAFVVKVFERYRPGGVLAREEGWGEEYGVLAMEFGNEPGSYLTNWRKTANDYAEFVTRASMALRAIDARVLVLGPAIAAGDIAWLEEVVDANAGTSSEVLAGSGERYAIGPGVDVVTFHNYEQLDQVFAGEPHRIQQVFADVRGVFERFETQEGFEYGPKLHYWHTEGGYDYLSFASDTKRANWMLQFFARSFHAGMRKVTIQDAQGFPLQQAAVKTMVELLPEPFPMERVNDTLEIDREDAEVYRVVREDGATVYLLWAANGVWRRRISLPVASSNVARVSRAGEREQLEVNRGEVEVVLKGSSPFSEPLFVVVEP